jgi:hypothetical protein
MSFTTYNIKGTTSPSFKIKSGVATAELHVMRGQSTNATATELFLDGASTQLTLPDNSVSLIHADFVGNYIQGSIQETSGYRISTTVTSFNSTVTLANIPAETVYQESTSTWYAEILAGGASSNVVKFIVHGEIGKIINWTTFINVATSVQ